MNAESCKSLYKDRDRTIEILQKMLGAMEHGAACRINVGKFGILCGRENMTELIKKEIDCDKKERKEY